MCFEITSGPTVSPKKINPGGTVTVRIRLRSATPATVKVTCDPGSLGPVQSRTVTVNPTASVAFTLQLGAVKPGAYQVEVQIEQSGCATERHSVGLTVLVPEPAGEA